MAGMVHPALAAVRGEQLGVWTRSQARGADIAYSTIRRWVASERVVELFPGVMADAALPVAWEQRAIGAQLWMGGDVLLSHHSAAQVLGLRLPRSEQDQPIHLLVSCRTRPTPPGIVLHRTTRPLAEHRAERGAHAVTNATRTTCDLSATLGPRALRRLVSHAVRSDLTSADELRETMEFLGRFAGKVALRRIVDELSPLEQHTRSELESLYLRTMRPFGLEPDVVNHPVRDAQGLRRFLDAAYLPEHVPVELDSHQEHGTLLDWNDDIRRANDIVLIDPWRPILRFSWDDLQHHAAAVAERVRTALRAAGTTRAL